MTEPTLRASARRPWLAGSAAFNAFGAWAGAVGLATGGMDFGESINDRLPFDSLVLAGLALGIIVGIPLTALAWSAWVGGPRTDDLALAVGLTLIGWIVVQVAVIRAFSLFQPAYLAVGAAFVAASHRVSLSPHRRGVLILAVGSVLAAVGVGLLPHPIKNGLTTMSVVTVALLLSGIALVGFGAVYALRGRRRVGALAGGAVVLVVLAATVSIIAPAVAATNVPTTQITSTPSALGLEYESVTLTTTDGVQLAAWYMPGTNGAGLVIMHGAGSTRSDVLDQAAVLAHSGYTVVLIDARGHGDSRGTTMDFGWYGDLDIAAGTDYLASRPEVDPGRIGVVGFSMGGEEAIGAAAADSRIRAVVAEGATARQAADKAWLSDVYGWRGWLQEQVEKAQDRITDYLTEASPPIALRSAVANAPGTCLLLITAGNLDDEGHAASYIQAATRDRVAVWNVDGADHTGGYDTQPVDWEQRVVEFLDESLT
ncbi:MAG: alpha/beta fold hydrolase [Actinomycetota bacterium]|nr:alpha/beta fold hydrolase [Actinomycetota bacterium]